MADKQATEGNNNSENNSGMGGLLWITILIFFTLFMGNASNGGLKTKEEFFDSNSNTFEFVTYTTEDQQNLVMLVLCEAGNQPYNCQVAVAATVINRVRENPGSTITSVIAAPGQFAVYGDGMFWVDDSPVTIDYFYDNQINNAQSAVNAALTGRDPTKPIGGSLYFYSLKGLTAEEKESRENIRYKMKFGDMFFYREWTE